MGTSPANDSSTRGPSKSPKIKTSPPRQDAATESTADAAPTKLLAPPPRPGQQQGGENTPDFFNATLGGSLSLEPNPFEQSFGGGTAPETPGGTKLPSVAALTSPSSLLPGSGVTPFWGAGSLRTGPLSPAMLSGPTTDYFSDAHHIGRGSFPTPNESSLRTGLTPGGSGSMFPAASPSSAALFASLGSAGATPTTIDFHRTALSAAAKRDQQAAAAAQQAAITSNPTQQELTNGVNGTGAAANPKADTGKAASGPFEPHDNDAANGLFLLSQGRNGTPAGSNQFAVPAAPAPPVVTAIPPPVIPPPSTVQVKTNASPEAAMATAKRNAVVNGKAPSDAGSGVSDESEPPRPNTRGKGKRNSTAAGLTNGNGNGKAGARAAEERKSTPPKKKAKGNAAPPPMNMDDLMMDEDDDDSDDDDKKLGENGKKMTDEEKRKNFLERNRVAALKCRQRKKQWLASLQAKVEMYSSENDTLTTQITALREEVVNLKTLLLAHKDCPVSQQQGLHQAYMQQQGVVDAFGGQINPYQMAAPMSAQGIIAGQAVNRRYS